MTTPAAGGHRLLLANTVTGQVHAELPMGNQVPTWQRQLNNTGSLTAQVSLSPRLDDDTYTMLTEPWRWTVVYAYGNSILQAGLLTGFDFDDMQGFSATVRTATLWEFLGKKALVAYCGAGQSVTQADVIFSPTSPDLANRSLSWGSVAARLVGIYLANAGQYALPIRLPDLVAGSATVTYAVTDLAYTGQRLTELTQQDAGPEIEFVCEWNDSSQQAIVWRMRVGEPRLGQLGYPHVWDYRQACQSLKTTLDGSRQAFGVIAKGADNRTTSGTFTYAEISDMTWPAAGWPWMQTADTTHLSETSQAVISSYATGTLRTFMPPLWTAQATIRIDGRNPSGLPTGSPSIEALSTGDTAVMQVRDHAWIYDAQYACRILSIGSGMDPWTATLDLQVMGGVVA
ncbi:hypothetical protein [Saccharopolyspora pogona]|uniref:hypothetical protein n=1 Tax=Saccharopolyspora pogona TaxID=333966 RepID=UPI001683E8C5|nr:hypothetical protein [Saccharopolyspora pogona]